MSHRNLSALNIGNFKAFADTQRIPLKPITLIFGPNSAGKSSFIQSLAFAHEAEFGRDKRGAARLDVHHTDIGGSSIDLGGFRQFVHRGQADNRVTWGAELDAAALGTRLRELLEGVKHLEVNLTLGIELDNEERPKPGADPRVDAIEVAADGEELLHMSYRHTDERGIWLRLDRLAVNHPVLENIIRAILESTTTAQDVREEDLSSAADAISSMLPKISVRAERLFPRSVTLLSAKRGENTIRPTLVPVSKGNRPEDIALATQTYLPGVLNDFVKGLSQALSDDLQRLQYLGPIRSLPPRHIAFAEQGDADWYAGGAYAWDLVRRDDDIRASVNAWLGSDKLKTPYELRVRSLVALDQIQGPLEAELEEIGEHIDYEPDYDDTTGEPLGATPFIDDVEAVSEHMMLLIDESDADRILELVLVDQRSNTVVSHRDVGIGISQVLPVLVMAYGSRQKLIAIEQPEIHLHPALQAELGDVFIESALSERKNTFILETHSEHLILRLMRRMRETWQGKHTGLPAITPDDVSILYVEPDGPRSIVREMPLNEAGELVKAWPGGFFEEGLKEQFPDA